MATVVENKMQRVTDSLNGLYRSLTDVYAQKNAQIKIRANAFGSGLSYQWQISTNGGSTWNNSTAVSANTDTLITAATTVRNGYQWRCVITYNGGKQITSPVRLNLIDDGKSYDRGAVSVLAADYAGDHALTAETAARTAADAILTAQAQSTARSLDFLWKLNKGISYDFETDETAAYSKTVPTGAHVCDVRSVGGHSEVIDGEIVSADVTAIDIVRADDSITITIPAAVRALEGYGWSAGTVFNEVDFANKKFIKRVDKVDLGECTWGHNGTNADGSTQFITRSVEDRALSTNGICDIFTVGNTVDGAINLRTNSYAFTANTSAYTSPSVFRTAMSGHYLFYELATPVETDISALLTDSTEDIEVESGGSITMEQDGTQLSVPSKVEYLIALNEVET